MDFDNISDEQLALYLQKNNGKGIERIIDRYEKPLLRYASRLTGDQESAEDAVQNTFISAYQNINSYDPERPFSPWIYRIAHNKTIDEVRNKKPQISLDEVMEIPDPDPSEPVTSALDRKALKKTLKGLVGILPMKYKETIVLRYFEDKSYEEISDILKIPKNTVGVRIKRGLGKLKIDINDNFKDYL